jgi:tRNA(Ile)-lysidine synthase
VSVIDKALDSYLKKYSVGAVVGVAVSGGADSLCLALHLAEISQKYRFIVKAVTVDHQLRPESADEAKYVHEVLEKVGISHDVLVWQGKKPTTRLEEKAREKRYELLEEWCRENGISHLFLGHHAGDQAETFWARLTRGSGLDGLAGMGECVQRNDIFLCRPLLALDKKVFEEVLRMKGISWAEDSMNADESYERVRWRNRQNQFDNYGLTTLVLGRSMKRLQRVREAVDFYVGRFFDTLVDIMPEGYALVQMQAFLQVPAEIRLRVLEKTIKAINPNAAVISLDGLEKWFEQMPKKATLGGCVLTVQKGLLFVSREASRMAKAVIIPENKITHWDRFMVLSSCPVHLSVGNKDKTLPVDVRGSIPSVSEDVSIKFMCGMQKELEKRFALDYKKRKQNIVIFLFKRCK